MVILGGLEIVAAGYVLNELSKDNKKASKRRRHDHDRPHHHHRPSHDSGNRPSRPPSRPPQGLQPPMTGPPRPYSAPPPGFRPAFEPQPFPGQQQQWRPQQNPVQPQQYPGQPQNWQPRPGPVQAQTWQPQSQPQFQPQSQPLAASYYAAATVPQQRPPQYPPPGVHIDMKTGKIQHNMLPADMQSRGAQTGPRDELHRSLSDRDRLQSDSAFYDSDSSDSSFEDLAYGEHPGRRSQPQVHRVPSPHPGYSELDAETPGRARPYNEKHAQQGRGRGQSQSVVRREYDEYPLSPPPAYRE